MPKVTIELPEELAEQLAQVGDRLPELVALSLQQPPLPASVYQYILDFLTTNPTPEAIANFGPTVAMQERLQSLLSRNESGILTPNEEKELAAYERIEHFMILLKTGNLFYLPKA